MALYPLDFRLPCLPMQSFWLRALQKLQSLKASLIEHRLLLDALRRHGRVCQVGFQALGSAALHELIGAVPGSRTGTVAAHGAWWRPDSYW